MKVIIKTLSTSLLLLLVACSNKDNNTLFEGPSNRYLISVGENYGYIDKDGIVKIKPQFRYARHFRSGLAVVGESTDGLKGYIDTTGKVVIEMQFNDAEPFSEGFAQVKIGNSWGYINRKGKFIVEPKYEQTFPFSEGLAAVKEKGGGWGFIDVTGNYMILPQFDEAESFSNGLAAADGGYISHDGKKVLKGDYIRTCIFSEGRALVIFKGINNGQCSVIDTSGNIIISNINHNGFHNVAFSHNRLPVEGANGKGYGYINKHGNFVILPNYDNACSFKEGLARVCRNDIWGYIDTTGKVIIRHQYTGSSDFREGLALVTTNGYEYKYIDTLGNVVFEFIADPYFLLIYNLSFGYPKYDMSL